MNDERMQSLLDAWYRDRDEAPRDPSGGIARVMDKVPQVRQRSRWWPLPVFDRPASSFPGRDPAPAPIPATDGRQPARGFTMSSAVKFVVAGVIVALFGGFLLAGVLTTPQGDEMAPAAVSASPTTEAVPEATAAPTNPTDSGEPVVSTDILPGVELTVEEVEPGVLRVLHDGVRDLALDDGAWPVTGGAGGLWLFDEQGFFRLGTDGRHDWPADLPAPGGHDGIPLGFDVAPDGTIWALHQRVKGKEVMSIRSFDGETWTLRKKAKDTNATECAHPTRAFAISGDGEVWASWTDPDADTKKEAKATVVARLGADGWEPLPQTIETMFGGTVPLFVTGEGEVWATSSDGRGRGRVLRYADGAWETMTPEGIRHGCTVDIGRDGTVWLVGNGVAGCSKDDACLMRYDGTDWQGWPDAPGWVASHVAPDGSLWIIREPYSRGLARFDGSEWRYPFGDRLIARASPILWHFDIADDGTVWFVASDTDAHDQKNRHPHLYVITPEAVAATE